jgi:hypothetical protein
MTGGKAHTMKRQKSLHVLLMIMMLISTACNLKPGAATPAVLFPLKKRQPTGLSFFAF